MKVLVELPVSECWLAGSGLPCGLRLRLRASGEEGDDGVNIMLGKGSVLVLILVWQHGRHNGTPGPDHPRINRVSTEDQPMIQDSSVDQPRVNLISTDDPGNNLISDINLGSPWQALILDSTENQLMNLQAIEDQPMINRGSTQDQPMMPKTVHDHIGSSCIWDRQHIFHRATHDTTRNLGPSNSPRLSLEQKTTISLQAPAKGLDAATTVFQNVSECASHLSRCSHSHQRNPKRE